ncbi:DUF6985 domain-containing protein [uncultured Clostridium sp.]|uniref:DUF6985 domain-containing protein n=1 Tax=uncultured Clostridium sp. TaxID=59620 RepID=UPI0028F12486|nr:hypothetical protein [uncultured Clostridium sp.]
MKIPNVSLSEFGYEGTIELQSWNEFLTDLNGVYSLDIGGDMVEENPTISQEHIAAYNYAIKNQNIIRDSIITVLMEKYPGLQSEYGYDEDEAVELMPDIKDKEDFKDLIGLSRIHIMNIFKDGIAYTGYEFTCTWDEEHGLGVMMYQNKVIAMGGADTSFLTWVAKEDAEK